MKNTAYSSLPALLFLTLPAFVSLVTIAACGSRTELEDDRFFRGPKTTGDDDGEAGLVDGQVTRIDGGGLDSSYEPPPRDDAGRLLGCGGERPPPLLITHRDYFGKVSCIDATEVTNDDYAAFLAARPGPSGPSAACASKTNYAPTAAWPAPGDHGDYPVVYVDWCDARAYCAWAGKDLCRNHSTEPGNPAFAGDPQIDGWSAACTGNRAQAYPYGANFDIQACNGKDLGLNQVTPAKIPPRCQGSDPGVYGMSGNVWEWEDACDDETSPDGACLVRGGSFRSDSVALRCDASQRTPRTETRDDVGFRCCIE